MQEKKEKEELEGRVKLLAELDEKYEDLGACSISLLYLRTPACDRHCPQAAARLSWAGSGEGLAATCNQCCARTQHMRVTRPAKPAVHASHLPRRRVLCVQAPCWTAWCGTMARHGRRRWTPPTCTSRVSSIVYWMVNQEMSMWETGELLRRGCCLLGPCRAAAWTCRAAAPGRVEGGACRC